MMHASSRIATCLPLLLLLWLLMLPGVLPAKFLVRNVADGPLALFSFSADGQALLPMLREAMVNSSAVSFDAPFTWERHRIVAQLTDTRAAYNAIAVHDFLLRSSLASAAVSSSSVNSAAEQPSLSAWAEFTVDESTEFVTIYPPRSRLSTGVSRDSTPDSDRGTWKTLTVQADGQSGFQSGSQFGLRGESKMNLSMSPELEVRCTDARERTTFIVQRALTGSALHAPPEATLPAGASDTKLTADASNESSVSSAQRKLGAGLEARQGDEQEGRGLEAWLEAGLELLRKEWLMEIDTRRRMYRLFQKVCGVRLLRPSFMSLSLYFSLFFFLSVAFQFKWSNYHAAISHHQQFIHPPKIYRNACISLTPSLPHSPPLLQI